MQLNKYTHTHTHTQSVCPVVRVGSEAFVISISLIPPWEDQCKWHRMTRMTGPGCAVMCNLINIHSTYKHTHRGGAGTIAVAEMATETGDGNEDRTGEDGGEVKKREKPNKSCCRRDVGNGGDLGGKKKNRRQQRVFKKILNASKPSEHPPSGEKLSKDLDGNIVCRDKNSS